MHPLLVQNKIQKYVPDIAQYLRDEYNLFRYVNDTTLHYTLFCFIIVKVYPWKSYDKTEYLIEYQKGSTDFIEMWSIKVQDTDPISGVKNIIIKFMFSI